MAHRCIGNGLMLAGLIVMLIGLVVALSVTFAIPRHWTTVLIGAALFVAGILRRVARDRRDASGGGGR